MSGSKVELKVNGCLFDLDGTLMLSTGAVEEMWKEVCAEHNLNYEEIIAYSHGVKTVEVLKKYKPELGTDEIVGKLEGAVPKRWAHMAKPVPGVHKFLESLPASQWGIVTSGSHPMASGWLTHFLKITPPEVFITAEMVKVGKPDPMGYKKGAELLSLKSFLVFEDAPAGIKAGKAAGATVIALATTYDADYVKKAGADFVIKDLESVKFESFDEATKTVTISVHNRLDV